MLIPLCAPAGLPFRAAFVAELCVAGTAGVESVYKYHIISRTLIMISISKCWTGKEVGKKVRRQICREGGK